MSGISADDLGQVSGPRFHLNSEGLLVHNILVNGQKKPGLVLPPLGQSALYVVKVHHRLCTARFMDQSLPTKRFIYFLQMGLCVAGMANRVRSS